MANNRKFARLPFDSNTTITIEGKTHRTRLIDISLTGALLETPEGLETSTGVAAVLEIHLQNSDISISMNTEIAHRSEHRLGVRCIAIDMDSMIHLRRLMELNLGDPTLLERELLSL